MYMDDRNVFGSCLMKDVRDKTIKRMFKYVLGQFKSPNTRDIQSGVSVLDDSTKELIEKFVVESVDNCLFNMLIMLDERDDSFKVSIDTDGKKIWLQDGSGDLEELFYFWRDDYGEFKNDFYNAV